MIVKRQAQLQDGEEVAVWMAKSLVRGSRYGAGNRAAPNAGGSGCWVRAEFCRYASANSRGRQIVRLRLQDGRSIPLPALAYLQAAPFDLHAPAPRR